MSSKGYTDFFLLSCCITHTLFLEQGYLQVISTFGIWSKWENSKRSNLKTTGSSYPCQILPESQEKELIFRTNKSRCYFYGRKCRSQIGSYGWYLAAGKKTILGILKSYIFSPPNTLILEHRFTWIAWLFPLCPPYLLSRTQFFYQSHRFWPYRGCTLKQEVKRK